MSAVGAVGLWNLGASWVCTEGEGTVPVFKGLETYCLFRREDGNHVKTRVTQNGVAVKFLASFACLSLTEHNISHGVLCAGDSSNACEIRQGRVPGQWQGCFCLEVFTLAA